jgi:hypothetical protein
MKSIYYVAWLTAVLLSCSDMEDSYKHYYDGGETIYAAKVDSVAPHPGKNRIEFEIMVRSQRIQTARIFWNDFRDSSDLVIEGRGVFKKVLDNLDERSYIFNIVSLDEYGNKSLPVEVNAVVYGDKYQARIVNRAVRSTLTDIQGAITIRWGEADVSNGAFASEVRYTDVAGNTKLASFPVDEVTATITDLKPNTSYEFRTVYKPDSTSIDVFYTDYAPAGDFTFDKKDWQVIDFSTQHGGAENGVANFIDGTEGTRWHTCAGCSSYPHFATMDMGVVRSITKIGVWITTFSVPEGDNRAPDKIQFLVSMDNVTWTDLGVVDFNRFKVGEQTYTLPPATQGRYLKFVGVSGPETYMVMGEISAYGL